MDLVTVEENKYYFFIKFWVFDGIELKVKEKFTMSGLTVDAVPFMTIYDKRLSSLWKKVTGEEIIGHRRMTRISDRLLVLFKQFWLEFYKNDGTIENNFEGCFFRSYHLSPIKKRLVCPKTRTKIFDLALDRCQGHLSHPCHVTDAMWLSENRIVTICHDGKARIWDTVKQTELFSFEMGVGENITGTSNEEHVALSGSLCMKVWKITDKAVCVLEDGNFYQTMSFSPCGNWLAGACRCQIVIWSLVTKQIISEAFTDWLF